MSEGKDLNQIIKNVFANINDVEGDAKEAWDKLPLDNEMPSISELWKSQDDEQIVNQVLGDWTVNHLIGKGGMSVVYLVTRNDPSVIQQGAMKILPIELASQNAVERFVRERQILIDLDHPNIAKLLDLGVTESNIPWYVMSYFEGQDVISFLSSVNANMTQKTVLFKNICQAISYAHQQGVVHRDIKPGNILVNDQYEVKVLDFGIALKDENTALTMTGAILGTPGYMSPEQSKGQNDLIDARSDVFSLGVLFYHMLMGNKPFQADSAAEMGFEIINEEPMPMGQQIPNDLQAIIHQCLDKKPNRRYATAGALTRDIEAYLSGDVVSAKPVTWAGYWFKRGKKHPKTSALIVTVLMLAVLGIGFGLYQNNLNKQRLQAAEVFVKQAEEIKNKVRRVHMLPVHNVQPEYEGIRNQISSLQTEIGRSGADQSGLTDLALGSAYLSMRDFEPALKYLQLAQSKGWKSKDLDDQLGYVLAVEWSYQSKAAKSIKDENAKEQHLNEARKNYYQPAVKLLAAAGEQSHYLSGRLAWIEERYDDAVAQYLEELKINPWHHEAAKQISEVFMNQFRLTGKSAGYDEAMPFMDKSNEYLDLAIEIGRSDPLNYVSRCTNAGIEIQIKRFLKRYDEMPHAFSSGMAVCEQALELEPTAFSPFANMNLLFLSRAMMLELQELPVVDIYRQALEVAQRGLKLHPQKQALLVAQIKPLIKLAENAVIEKLSPENFYTKAIDASNQIIASDPSSSLGWKELGRTFWAVADYHQYKTENFNLAVKNMLMAHKSYVSEAQSNISVTSHLNAALIGLQLAELYAETDQIELAIQTIKASIRRRIELLPDSRSYFKYLKQVLDDIEKLNEWDDHDTEIKILLTAVVTKSCAIEGVPAEELTAFNAQLEILNYKLVPLKWALCELNLGVDKQTEQP